MKLLGLLEVLIESPKVLQVIKHLLQCAVPAPVAIGHLWLTVTKVDEDQVSNTLFQVTFSLFIRDLVVLTIQGRFRKGYTEDFQVKRLNCFAADVLSTISDVAMGEPQSNRQLLNLKLQWEQSWMMRM